jgi:hypothetical protein
MICLDRFMRGVLVLLCVVAAACYGEKGAKKSGDSRSNSHGLYFVFFDIIPVDAIAHARLLGQVYVALFVERVAQGF